jgi:hypothetical protein
VHRIAGLQGGLRPVDSVGYGGGSEPRSGVRVLSPAVVGSLFSQRCLTMRLPTRTPPPAIRVTSNLEHLTFARFLTRFVYVLNRATAEGSDWRITLKSHPSRSSGDPPD